MYVGNLTARPMKNRPLRSSEDLEAQPDHVDWTDPISHTHARSPRCARFTRFVPHLKSSPKNSGQFKLDTRENSSPQHATWSAGMAACSCWEEGTPIWVYYGSFGRHVAIFENREIVIEYCCKHVKLFTRLSIFSWNGAWDGWSNWNFEAVRKTWIWFIVINRYTSPPSHVGPCHRDWKSLNTVLEQLDFNVLNSWVDLGPTYVHEGGASRTDFILYRNLHTDQKSKQVKYLHHHPMHQNSGCRHVPMIATLASRSVSQHSRSPFHWRRHLKQNAENTFVRTRHCGINRLRCLNVHPWSAYDGLRTMKILIDVSMVALNFPNSLQIALRYRFPGRCSDSFFITRLWRKNCRVGVSKPTSKLGFTAARDLYFENRWTMLWGAPRSGGNGTSWTRPRSPLQHMTWDSSFRS